MAHKSPKIRREQLDRALAKFKESPKRPVPGWLTEIRRALGLSMVQVAKRLGTGRPNINGLEKSEAADTITLASLRRYADAMDCDLVYAVVPRAGSLEAQLRARAEMVARRMVHGVTHTMALENQAPEPEHVRRQVQELADELVRTMSSDLWREPE